MSNLNRRDFGKWMAALGAGAMAPMSALNAALPREAAKTVVQSKILDFNITRTFNLSGVYHPPAPPWMYDESDMREQTIEVTLDFLPENGEHVHRLEFQRKLYKKVACLSFKELDSPVSQNSVNAYDILGNQVSLEKLTIEDYYDLDVVVSDYKNSPFLLFIKDMKLVKFIINPKEEEEEEEQEDDEYYDDYDRDYNEYLNY